MSVLEILEEIKDYNEQILVLQSNIEQAIKYNPTLPTLEKLQRYYNTLATDIPNQIAKRIFIFCVLYENDRLVLLGNKQIKSGLRLLIREVIGGSPSLISHIAKNLFFEFKVYSDFRCQVEKYLTLFNIK